MDIEIVTNLFHIQICILNLKLTAIRTSDPNGSDLLYVFLVRYLMIE